MKPALLWQQMRSTLGGYAAFLGVTTLLVGASLLWKNERREIFQQQLTRLQQLQASYQQLAADAHLIQTHRQRYRKLQQSGFIGQEQRLQWVAAVRDSALSQHLYRLEYRMQQQQIDPVSTEDSPFTLYSSRMQPHLELAHEAQLLRFFDQLQSKHRGHYELEHCALKPMFSEEGIKRDKTNIVADCQLRWYTLHERSADQPDREDGKL